MNISSRIDANRTVPEFISLISPSPSWIYFNILSTKVEILDAKNTFHVRENDQKVLGLDISYANSEPPIGAPKAALTPAATPAASNLRFSVSFLK